MRVLLLIASTLLGGCFDSQRAAAARSPRAATDRGRFERGPSSAAKVFRIRVHATPAYAAQTVDWKREARGVVDDASQALVAAAGARLEIAAIESWPASADPTDLGAALEALARLDPGDGVSWVVGFVGGPPKATPVFDELGIGALPGKHVVLRAASDLTEADAVDSAYFAVGADERKALLRERRRHRSVAALLHEIGHTLGAIHEASATSVMHPVYAPSMRGFGKAAEGLLRASIGHREKIDDPASFGPWAQALLANYERAAPSAWDERELVAIVTELRAITAPKPPPVDEPRSGPRPVSEVASILPAADRERYARAVDLLRDGDPPGAWQTATPLFSTYPDLLPVQDLRCQIAMRMPFDVTRLRAECERLMKLSTGK